MIKKRQQKSKIYFVILLFVTSAIAVSIVMISGLLFFQFNRMVQDEIISSNIMSNQYISSQVQGSLQNALTVSNKIYGDYLVTRLINNKDPDIYEINQAFIQLRNYRLTNSAIHSIYIYSASRDTLYVETPTSNISSIWENFSDSMESFTDRDAVDLMQNLDACKPYTPIPRKITEGENNSDYCYSYLLYDIYSKAEKRNFMLINFSYDSIFAASALQSSSSSDIFAINKQGILVSESKSQEMLSDLSENAYIQTILKSEEKSGVFTESVGNTACLINYDGDNPYGWFFISIISWSDISQKINQMKLITLLSDLMIFFLLLVVAYLISGRVYSPISEIITEWKNDKSKLQSNKMVLRQIFLRDVILGRVLNSKESIENNYRRYELNLKYDCAVCVILFRIDQYSSFCQENTHREQNAIKYGILNITQEILSVSFQSEGTEIDRDIFAVVVNIAANAESTMDISNALVGYFENIQQKIKAIFDVSISAAVSPVNKMENITLLYQETAKALHKRFFQGNGSIILCSDGNEFALSNYVYPEKSEKRLIDFLVSLNPEEAKQEFRKMAEELENYPVICTSMAMTRLAFAINSLIKAKKIEDTCQPPMEAETFSQIEDFFCLEIDKICNQIEEEKNDKYIDIIEKVDQIIYSEYANAGLSVDFIAEKVKISVSYLCRLYKQYTYSTILDQVLQVRISKAKELLIKTRMSVGEVALETGFSSASYFNKVFRKINGVTPNRFRQNYIDSVGSDRNS